VVSGRAKVQAEKLKRAEQKVGDRRWESGFSYHSGFANKFLSSLCMGPQKLLHRRQGAEKNGESRNSEWKQRKRRGRPGLNRRCVTGAENLVSAKQEMEVRRWEMGFFILIQFANKISVFTMYWGHKTCYLVTRLEKPESDKHNSESGST